MTNFEITENSLSTLKNDNFANSVIFAIPDFLDFFGYLATLVLFYYFGTTLQILPNQH